MSARAHCRMLLTAVLAAWAIAACKPATVVERSWTEDVQLEDGRVVVVERYVELILTRGLGGPAGSVEERSSLSIPELRRAIPHWEIPLSPLVLYHDQSSKEWVIVALSTDCGVWQRRGRPPGGYFEFRSSGSWWRPVPLSAASVGRKTNLLFLYDEEIPEHVTLADKNRLQAASDIDPHYRSIDLTPGAFGCAPYDSELQPRGNGQ